MRRFIQKNYILQDLMTGSLLAIVFSQTFFHSFMAVILFSFAFPWYYKMRSQVRMQKERRQNLEQLRDLYMALSSALNAGYSFENATGRAEHELGRLWPDDAFILRQFMVMRHKMIHASLACEEAFFQFSTACRLDIAVETAECFKLARAEGTSLQDLFRSSGMQIQMMLSVEEEIQTGITQMKYETRLMLMMPPGVLLYLQLCSMGLILPLYTSLVGRITMVICFLLYIFAYWLTLKISKIEVS